MSPSRTATSRTPPSAHSTRSLPRVKFPRRKVLPSGGQYQVPSCFPEYLSRSAPWHWRRSCPPPRGQPAAEISLHEFPHRGESVSPVRACRLPRATCPPHVLAPSRTCTPLRRQRSTCSLSSSGSRLPQFCRLLLRRPESPRTASRDATSPDRDNPALFPSAIRPLTSGQTSSFLRSTHVRGVPYRMRHSRSSPPMQQAALKTSRRFPLLPREIAGFPATASALFPACPPFPQLQCRRSPGKNRRSRHGQVPYRASCAGVRPLSSGSSSDSACPWGAQGEKRESIAHHAAMRIRSLAGSRECAYRPSLGRLQAGH